MTDQNSKILNLPKDKNITEFTDKELALWLKEYLKGWGSGEGVTPSRQYELIKTELERRYNKSMSNLTKKLHFLTITLVGLTIILVLLTGVLLFK